MPDLSYLPSFSGLSGLSHLGMSIAGFVFLVSVLSIYSRNIAMLWPIIWRVGLFVVAGAGLFMWHYSHPSWLDFFGHSAEHTALQQYDEHPATAATQETLAQRLQRSPKLEIAAATGKIWFVSSTHTNDGNELLTVKFSAPQGPMLGGDIKNALPLLKRPLCDQVLTRFRVAPAAVRISAYDGEASLGTLALPDGYCPAISGSKNKRTV